MFIRNRQELEHLLVTLKAQGWGIRPLSRRFGISRNMVRRILRKQADLRDHGHDLLAPNKGRTPCASKLDPFVERIKQLLERFPDITGQRVYEELRDAGYQGGISIVRDRLRLMRPKPKREPVVRFETEPGRQGQMDWSPYTIRFTRSGTQKVQCFSYILGYSRRHYIDFTPRRDFYTLIRRHRDAFEHFGGVPLQCLYDSKKTVVLRWEAGQPVPNPQFLAFITHYRCRPIICRPGRPQTKGKIEAPFQYVEKNLLGGRSFSDLEELRRMARWWMANRSDPHLHGTTRRAPLELFLQEEAGALQPLPLHPYDTAEVALRVCGFDGFLEFETNRYSVPYEHMADILAMKITESEVLIYGPELELIAGHERLPAGGGKTSENPQHRGAKALRYGLEPVRAAFEALGAAAEEFLGGIKQKHPHNPGFHARYILGLKERYHCDDIHRALLHALRYGACDGKAVERILKARATPRTLESLRNERAGQELKKALPEIQQRPLEHYQELFEEAHRHGTSETRADGTDSKPPEDPEAHPDGEGPR